jgi:capsular polysaccharide biosynthesis protein
MPGGRPLLRMRRSLRRLRRIGPMPTPAEQRGPDPLDDFVSLLPRLERRTVAVLASGAQRYQVQPWLARFRGENVHVISDEAAAEWPLEATGARYHFAQRIGDRSVELGLLGPVHVLINLIGEDENNHLQMWRRFFFHVAKDGVYIVDPRPQQRSGFANALATWARELVDPDDPDAQVRRRDTEYVRACAGVVVTRDLVIIKKRTRHHLIVQHGQAHRVLAEREPSLQVEVLARLRRGQFRSTADVHLHESSRPVAPPEPAIAYPELHLRHYRGRIAFLGRMLFVTGDSILPDSFRHFMTATRSDARLAWVSPSFGRLAPHSRPAMPLAGNYYNLDSPYSGHYGHLTTEGISRLWGWETAKATIPDLKAIVHIAHPNHREPTLERRIFGAYGIDPDDIVCVDRPVLLESLVSATPMWHNAEPHFVHPDMTAVWQRLTAGLIDPEGPRYERIFVSRGPRLRRRVCRNREEVEQFFATRGFTVIYPEQLDLGSQVRIFNAAEVVAGFGGSALFNIMHAQRLRTLIVLNHESYTARNEYLFSSLLGVTAHYFWSPADLAHPEDDWSEQAYKSAWEFDFARNRDELEKVIAGLD